MFNFFLTTVFKPNNMNLNRHKIFVGFLVMLAGNIFAQTYVGYTYDVNGNRTKRKLEMVPPCSNCPESGRQAQQAQVAQKYGAGVFPNPVSDKININFSNIDSKQEITAEISDEQGKQVLKQSKLKAQNEIDMSPFKQGMYYLRVTIGKDEIMYKIVKVQ